nr:glutamate--tRNA ligase family protein [Petrotogaceae bacterium]
NFTVVIDDMLMKVTHVFRGEDHISNTPKQIMLYEAFNAQPPRFAHIPLILGEDKTPLSKRHGGTSVEFFKEEGYLPQALMNYLGVLGWTAEEQIFNIQDKVEQFSMEMVSSKSVVFDYKKLMWINGEHMRSMDIDSLYSHFEDWLKTCKINLPFDKEYIKSVLDISRVKVSTLKQLYDFSYGFFTDSLEYCQEFSELKTKEWFAPVIRQAIEELENAVYTVDGISQALNLVAEKKFTNKKNTFQAVRGALMGRLITPGLYESITVLGKEKVLQRLSNVI